MASAVPALAILAIFLSDSSYAILVGVFLAEYWLATSIAERLQAGSAKVIFGRLHRCQSLCLVVLLACHLARPWFVASSMSGSTQFGTALSLVPTILSATRQGGLWYASSLALTVLIAAHFLNLGRSTRITKTIAIAALCVLAAAKAASSHASEEGDFTLAEICQFLHLLATSIWAGTIVVSGFLVVPRLATPGGAAPLWNYGSHLSKTVTWALAALVLSGVYVSWRDMHGAIDVLWVSSWGKLLLIKGSFVGVGVLLGSFSRFRCLARPATGDLATAMRNLLRAEAGVMLAILCISAVLANTSPVP